MFCKYNREKLRGTDKFQFSFFLSLFAFYFKMFARRTIISFGHIMNIKNNFLSFIHNRSRHIGQRGEKNDLSSFNIRSTVYYLSDNSFFSKFRFKGKGALYRRPSATGIYKTIQQPQKKIKKSEKHFRNKQFKCKSAP